MNFGLSGEMIFLAFLALLLFGPRRLPEIVKTVGRFAAQLKHASNEFRGQLSREVGELELSPPLKTPSSMTDRIAAFNAAGSPAKAIMTLAEPTQPGQQLGGTSLIDNVNRIKDLLAKDGEATEEQ